MAGLGTWWLLGGLLVFGSQEDTGAVIAKWRASVAGTARAQQVQQDLETCGDAELPALQSAAYELFLEEMGAFRGQSGERMARAMHSRAQATWSMICLSASQLRTGQGEAALETVREHLGRIRSSAPMPEVRAVWDRLALVARGLGQPDVMREALGHSLAMGSEDALQLLGWEGLQNLDWEDASRLFGALVDRAEAASGEPAPWALPGWGLALLERHLP
jgi:hypothetical protein